ncbi:MAG: ABC transporter permease subunit [Thermomicrobiales bacterium]
MGRHFPCLLLAYVESAVAIGLDARRHSIRARLPNIVAPLIVLTSLNFAFAVLAEASLAFTGLGNKPPAPSWGGMVSTTYGFLQLAWGALVPGIAIGLAVLAQPPGRRPARCASTPAAGR